MTTRKSVPAKARPAAKKIAPEKVQIPEKAAAKKPEKARKEKAVRDSFTMPQSEYRKIAEIKEASLKAGLPVKKSEVLRAGLKVLCGMNAAQLKRALAGVEKVRIGRPKKL
jgi:hypothetical protein